MSSKAVAPYDLDYSPSLDAKTMLVAETELRETEEVRKSALTAMRSWLDSNPRIVKCRYDANFLLQFLRHKKFSVPMAQFALEDYLNKRHQHYNYALSLEEENVLELYDRGLFCALPKRDSLGRMVIVVSLQAIDLNKHSFKDVTKICAILILAMCEVEENQINGYVYLFDLTAFSMQTLLWADFAQCVDLLLVGQNQLPMRHRKIFICNVGSTVVEKSLNLMISALSGKMRDRIQFIGKSDKFPGIDEDMLPKELGGTQLTMEETLQLSIKTWIDREKIAEILEKTNKLQINAQVQAKGFEEMQGNFRRLEVD